MQLEKLPSATSKLFAAQAVLHFSLVEYVGYARHVVVGVPDEYEVFGIKLTMNEIAYVGVVAVLLGLWISRNLFVLTRVLERLELTAEMRDATLGSSAVVFNPLARIGSGRLGMIGTGVNLMVLSVVFLAPSAVGVAQTLKDAPVNAWSVVVATTVHAVWAALFVVPVGGLLVAGRRPQRRWISYAFLAMTAVLVPVVLYRFPADT